MVRIVFASFLCFLAASSPAVPDTLPGRLTIERHAAELRIAGDVSSTAHEAILRQTALQLFPDARFRFEMRQRDLPIAGWALLTEMALRALAATNSSTATIDALSVRVRGVTADHDGWQRARQRLQNALVPGMSLVDEVIEIAPPESYARQCRSLLRAAAGETKVQFETGSNRLRTSAYPLLDRLVQIATDCPALRLTITGHTDNSGGEAGNVALSLARARAVVEYMTLRGIDPGRLAARGAGASEPLTDGATRYARQANRRISFSVEPAPP